MCSVVIISHFLEYFIDFAKLYLVKFFIYVITDFFKIDL